MAPLVFKTSGTGVPRPVGSIPATSAIARRREGPNATPDPAPASGRHDLDRDAVDRGVVRERVDEVRRARAGCCSRRRARGRPTGGCPAGRDPSRGAARRRRASSRRSPRPAPRRCRPPSVTRARPPSTSPTRGRVVGVDEQRAAVLALHEHLHVVHPRVVRAQVAAADEHEAVVGAVEARARGAGRSPMMYVAARGRSCPTACASISSSTRAPSGRGRCRAAASLNGCEREAVGHARRSGRPTGRCGSCRSSMRSGPPLVVARRATSAGVDALRIGRARRSSRRRARRRRRRRSVPPVQQPPRRARISHSCGPVGRRREDRRRDQLRAAAHGPAPDQVVEVRLLERRRARAGSRRAWRVVSLR